MTATLTASLLDRLCRSLKLDSFGTTYWGDMARRNISLHVMIKTVTMDTIKRHVLAHLSASDDRKVIVYTNERNRAKENLKVSLSKLMKAKGITGKVFPVHGGTGTVMKDWAVRAFCGSGEECGGNNVRVVPATGAFTYGVDAPKCTLVIGDGPAPSLVDYAQQLGRIRSLQYAAPGQLGLQSILVLSVPTFCFLVQRALGCEVVRDGKQALSDLHTVLRLLVLPSACQHLLLERTTFGIRANVDVVKGLSVTHAPRSARFAARTTWRADREWIVLTL
jgi:hypothetical protein